jgi:hypothetical protein
VLVGVFVGVISFRSNFCYTGPCSSSLALFVLFGWLRCLRSLEGVGHVVLSFFRLICLLFKLRMPCLSSYLLCADFRWAGSFGFEIGSRGLAAIVV